MGRKGGKYRKKDSNTPKTKSKYYDDGDEDMVNDEIDAFHKQRDVVPLDVNEDEADSDEEIEHPVFNFDDGSDDKEDNEDSDEEDDDLIEDDTQLIGRAAKIARQQKYLRDKIGGVDEEMDDTDQEEKERVGWGKKHKYYSADNVDYEVQSSDEELPAEEEAEVLRLQKEKAKSLTAEDFGLEDISERESEKEPTYEGVLAHGRPLSKGNLRKKAEVDATPAYEEIKKDLNDLTREEQMDAVNSYVPEVVVFLSELGDTLDQLENKVNPLLNKVRDDVDKETKGGIQYLEMKHQLLLTYCQAITFYLFLKSEGQSVRDHPVLSRLVEIKNLLDKVTKLDKNLPQLDDILQKDLTTQRLEKQVEECPAIKSCSLTGLNRSSDVPVEIQKKAEATEGSQVVDEIPLQGHKLRRSNSKQQGNEVDMQSMQMLKVRAALEEKLRQKGIFTSIAKNSGGARKRLAPVNGQLETLDDFDDDAMDLDKVNHRTGMISGTPLHTHKLSKLVAPLGKKPKVVSGDDDLPKRDDIGERRRKHELRVLAGAGIKSVDDVDDTPGTPRSEGDSGTDLDGQTESDLEFYKQVEEQHSAKFAAKTQMYSSSTTKLSPLSETLVDGKRQISYQMEKNRGLTRARKKLTKNPRKKYKLKHQKAMVRRKGQVRDIRKPTGPYGGEASGINASISRSVRFKS